MLSYYCPNCWEILDKNEQICPHCGYVLEKFQELAYEEKLLAALHHSVPERRIMAAQILGNIHSHRALAEFKKIIEGEETNYFFLRAVLFATAKINHPNRIIILQKATRKPSTLVSDLANQLLLLLSENKNIDEWDRHTG